jgi:hypothetical protein
VPFEGLVESFLQRIGGIEANRPAHLKVLFVGDNRHILAGHNFVNLPPNATGPEFPIFKKTPIFSAVSKGT